MRLQAAECGLPCLWREGRASALGGQSDSSSRAIEQTISRSFRSEQADALKESDGTYSSSDCVLSESIVVSSLLGTVSHSGCFEWRQTSAVRSSSLSSQVFWRVSVFLVCVTGGSSLLLSDHGEALSDSLSHGLDLGEVHLRLGGDLAHTKLLELFLNTQSMINTQI